MVRDSLEPDAKHFSVLMLGKKDVGIFWRKDTSGNTYAQGYGNAVHDFIWLKLTKRMNIFTGYKSFDGEEWTQVGTPQTVEMDIGDFKVGLALTSHHTQIQTEAVFENFENSNYFFPSAAPSASPAPTNTQGQVDLGKYNAVLPSELVIEGSKHTIKANGNDIWSREDGFTFASRPVTGDFNMTVRVTSIDAPHKWTKFGLMARDSFDPSAAHIFALLAPNFGFMTHIRSGSRQGTKRHSTHKSRPKSIWFRIAREGSIFRTYYSLEGESLEEVEWKALRSYGSFFVNEELQIGMAVTSHDMNQYATAEFDHFNIELPNGRRGLRGTSERVI